MEAIDTLVVGAGVVGLTVARACARAGQEVVICEKERLAGQGISSRNSGVIHAGLYYLNGSLKAQLCVAGADMLYHYCEQYAVPYQRIGKLIVATQQDEFEKLQALRDNAERNGVRDLSVLDRKEALAREPELDVAGALLSPNTGIVDAAQLVLSLIGQLEENGGVVAYGTEVQGILQEGDRLTITLNDGSDYKVSARRVINCAGLGAQKVASAVEGIDLAHVPALRMVRGNYFQMSGPSPFEHLIYPLPVKGGLGVHATMDLAGHVRFGPDVQPTTTEDYRPDESRLSDFEQAIESYYPSIRERQLAPDYVGIRPQIGELGRFADFVVSTEEQHGIKGLVNLFGIESPGLTSALALAEYVVDRLGETP